MFNNIIKISMILFLVPITISKSTRSCYAMDPYDYHDVERRKARVNLQMDNHAVLNSFLDKPQEHFYNAIQATSTRDIKEIYSGGVTRQDLLNLNNDGNHGKHNWNQSYQQFEQQKYQQQQNRRTGY